MAVAIVELSPLCIPDQSGVMALGNTSLRNQHLIGLIKSGPIIVCLALAAFLAMTADVAHASLFLVFDRTSGGPGTVVHVRTAGRGACAVCPHRLPLYFVETGIVDRIQSPDDPRLVQVGVLTVDDHANANGLFTVPEVREGRYVVMTYCDPCAPTSGGRVILPLGPSPPFWVFGSAAVQPTRVWPWVLAGLLAVSFAAAVFTWLVTRSRRRN